MKKWALFYFLLLSSFGYAQNWSGMYPGATYFYAENNGNTLATIKVDSSNYQGQVLFIFPELSLRDVYNENIVDANCMFWGSGPQCQWLKDNPTFIGSKIISKNNFVKYFNFYNDSLSINFNINLNDTQTVFQNSSQLIKYKCIYKDSATIFSSIDSLIKFKIIHYDSLGNLTSSNFQGDTITYSKNTGLLDGFEMGFFPNSITNITLKGIRNPNYGFIGLSYADIYNFQIGDFYETTYGSPSYLDRTLNEILTRTDNVSSVSYTIKEIKGTAYPPYPPSGYNYDTTIINKVYSKTYYVDQNINLSGNYILNSNALNGCWTGAKFSYISGYYINYAYCPSADCYGGYDSFQEWGYGGAYGNNIGQINESGSQNGTGGYSTLNTSYINLSGIECGSSFILSTNQIQDNFQINIFPNPANNQITIQSDQIIENGKIILTDLSGREIAHQNLSQSNSNQIDITNFSNGVYLLKICSGYTVLKIEKLVIEK